MCSLTESKMQYGHTQGGKNFKRETLTENTFNYTLIRAFLRRIHHLKKNLLLIFKFTPTSTIENYFWFCGNDCRVTLYYSTNKKS